VKTKLHEFPGVSHVSLLQVLRQAKLLLDVRSHRIVVQRRVLGHPQHLLRRLLHVRDSKCCERCVRNYELVFLLLLFLQLNLKIANVRALKEVSGVSV